MSCVSQFIISTNVIVCYIRVITKYNLVKVELDQVGEGLFRDIEAPVLLLSKEKNILRSNPRADTVFDLQTLMELPEGDRSVAALIPEFQPNVSHFDVAMDTKMGPMEFQCKLSDVYQMDEVLGSMLVFHDVTRERELARMKTERPPPSPTNFDTADLHSGFCQADTAAIYRCGHGRLESGYQERTAGRQTDQSELGRHHLGKQPPTKLINDVLDISKMEAGKIDWNFAQRDARGIIDQAINATHGLFAAKPSVHLVQDIPDDLPQVVADSDRVVQVVINLISNAVKFTDAGQITVAVEKEWSSLTVKVQDQGTGISKADQKLVFDKYKQVGDVITDKPTGTGLGLPISKEIVGNARGENLGREHRRRRVHLRIQLVPGHRRRHGREQH